MQINFLHIENLRNISLADLSFSPALNFIQGSNGAGKTSLLEAVYILARTKTFRQSNTWSLIKEKQKHLTLFAQGQNQQGTAFKVGLVKRGRTTEIKINGASLKRLSDLVQTLPVSIITPHSHRIIEEGPDNRRRMLNWGVFHVEHNFKPLATRYQRLLSQRNAQLKMDRGQINIWDQQLADTGEELRKVHVLYLDQWAQIFAEVSGDTPFLRDIKFIYQPGWDQSKSLINDLSNHRHNDKTRGFTSVGPHRSDIQIKIKGTPAKHLLSRGQQKVLVALLMISQSRLMMSAKGEKAVFLIDDLQSELDIQSQGIILNAIKREQCQALITTLAGIPYSKQHENSDCEGKMFHVEHGEFKQIE